MIRAFSILLLLFSFQSHAQKGVTVIYEFKRGGEVTIKQLLAVRDSVSFETVVYSRGSEVKYKKPLGAGFRSHNRYIDKARNLVLTQSQPMSRSKYLIEDTVQKLEWTFVDEEREILGYTCKRAIAKQNNLTLNAWYAPSLPFSFGPNGTVGLPGLILEVEYGSSKDGVRAVSVSDTMETIVEPTEGNLVTTVEFGRILKGLRN